MSASEGESPTYHYGIMSTCPSALPVRVEAKSRASAALADTAQARSSLPPDVQIANDVSDFGLKSESTEVRGMLDPYIMSSSEFSSDGMIK